MISDGDISKALKLLTNLGLGDLGDQRILQLTDRLKTIEHQNMELTSRLTGSEMDSQMKAMRIDETRRMLDEVKTARVMENDQKDKSLDELRNRIDTYHLRSSAADSAFELQEIKTSSSTS